MTTRDALSETFLPDITTLVKRFRKYLTRDEFRGLKAAIKSGDLAASAHAVLIQATLRLAADVNKNRSSIPIANAFWEFMELRDEWTVRIHEEGDVIAVSMSLYRLNQNGEWNGVQVRYR